MTTKSITGLIIICLFSAQIPAQNWQGLSGGTNGTVRNIYSDTINNRLVACGNFTTAGGVIVNEIAYYDGGNWYPYGNGAVLSGPVIGLTMYQNELYATGNFFNSSRDIVKWNGQDWELVGQCSFSASPGNLKVCNGLLYAMGNITSVNGQPFYRIAAYDGTNWLQVVDSIDFDFMEITDIAFYHDTLFIGGNFIHSGLGYESIVKYANGNWYPVGNGFKGSIANVGNLIEYDGKLVATGIWWNDVAENPSTSIAQWDGYTWQGIGGDVDGNFPAIGAVAVWDNDLYVSGTFETAGGVPAQSIAKWDGTQWCGLGSTFNSAVNTICIHNDEMYISCARTIDGDTVNYIAKWTGGNYTDTCGAIIGVEENNIETFELEIYPNPATNLLTIKTTAVGKSEYFIYDINGRKLGQSSIPNNQSVIDVSNFAEGIYLLQVQTEQGSVNRKFVKRK